MIRTVALGLTLLLQLTAGFAPGGVVLCIHDDGRCFLESSATPCCRVCPRAERGSEAARGGPPAVARDRGGDEDDHCRDYLLGATDARPPVVKTATSDAGRSAEPIGPAPALACASVPPAGLAPGEGTRETGPPLPPRSLALLRTVVLRC